MSKLIKEAEQRAINIAAFWVDFISFIDSVQCKTSVLTDDCPMQDKFNEGFALIRQAAYQSSLEAQARCFVFAGVGGEEAKSYSRTVARKLLERAPIEWLDKNFNVPSSWSYNDEVELKDELKEKLK